MGGGSGGTGSSGRSGGPARRATRKNPQGGLDVNTTSPYDRGGGAGAVLQSSGGSVPEPAMRTQAEQIEINHVRLQAELYRLQMDAKIHPQQQEFAQHMGGALQREQRQQPQVNYNIYNNAGPSSEGKPPFPAPALIPVVDPTLQAQALQDHGGRARGQREEAA